MLIERNGLVLLALAVAALATNALGRDQSAPEGAGPKLSSACESEMTSATGQFNDAFKANDWKGALAIASAAAEICRNDRLAMDVLDTMRADASLRDGDPTGVIAILKSPGVGEESAFWLQSRFVEIAALKKLGMEADYLAVRNELLAATERQLTTGSQPYMVKVERFATGYATVDAYEEIPRGRVLREVLFLASPKDGSMPVSISVSFRMQGAKQGRPLGDMDMTFCHGNELTVTDKNARTYADLKAQASSALDHLLGPGGTAGQDNVLASYKDNAQGVCPQASFIFRGLTPD